MTSHAVINAKLEDIIKLIDIQKGRHELICSTGKYFGENYYTVKPVGWFNWIEVELWCEQTFGKMGDIWDPRKPFIRWTANDAMFWFREEKDREWFILRWS